MRTEIKNKLNATYHPESSDLSSVTINRWGIADETERKLIHYYEILMPPQGNGLHFTNLMHFAILKRLLGQALQMIKERKARQVQKTFGISKYHGSELIMFTAIYSENGPKYIIQTVFHGQEDHDLYIEGDAQLLFFCKAFAVYCKRVIGTLQELERKVKD